MTQAYIKFKLKMQVAMMLNIVMISPYQRQFKIQVQVKVCKLGSSTKEVEFIGFTHWIPVVVVIGLFVLSARPSPLKALWVAITLFILIIIHTFFTQHRVVSQCTLHSPV